MFDKNSEGSSYLTNSLWEVQSHRLLRDVVVTREEEHILYGDTTDVSDVQQHGDEYTEPRSEHYERHYNAADVRSHFYVVDLLPVH